MAIKFFKKIDPREFVKAAKHIKSKYGESIPINLKFFKRIGGTEEFRGGGWKLFYAFIIAGIALIIICIVLQHYNIAALAGISYGSNALWELRKIKLQEAAAARSAKEVMEETQELNPLYNPITPMQHDYTPKS